MNLLHIASRISNGKPNSGSEIFKQIIDDFLIDREHVFLKRDILLIDAGHSGQSGWVKLRVRDKAGSISDVRIFNVDENQTLDQWIESGALAES